MKFTALDMLVSTPSPSEMASIISGICMLGTVWGGLGYGSPTLAQN